MKNEILSNLSKIIERESKSTTYKFALLRSTIDVIQENSPYIQFIEDRVKLPTGLLIEKWLLYYYPIIDSQQHIPQIHGDAQLAFQVLFKQVVEYYKSQGGFSAFYSDLRNNGVDPKIHDIFLKLITKLRYTITNMPMRHIGNSLNAEEYSIYKMELDKIKNIDKTDISTIINNCGCFTIPRDYYDAFKLLGSFIAGRDSILFKWADFSVNASSNTISIERVLNEVLKNPVTERDVLESKKLYKLILDQLGTVYCVWSGKKITNYDIDHMIPFSVWKNNDLWNLLPAQPILNNSKRDKIPSLNLLLKQKDLILQYWNLLESMQETRFKKEIKISLLGNNQAGEWQEISFKKLYSTCEYLIDTRGFQEWNPKIYF